MDVLFAVLPFSDPAMPTLGVSLLQVCLRGRGISSRIRYFNADFVDRIGVDLYTRIANSFAPETLIGEWLFADSVFGRGLPHEEEYIEQILARYPGGEKIAADILKIRGEARSFVDYCLTEIIREGPAIVGLPTTFHQTCPCLAIAKGLKQLASPPVVVFGGANCEGDMGRQIARSFPFIDYVCTQEGEEAFPALVESILKRGTTVVPAGIASSTNVDSWRPPRLVENLDALPIPDFTDYFDRVSRAPWLTHSDLRLLMETSRGCWWGAKQHCTFCGLNGATMSFRSKSPERAFSEMKVLAESYGIRKIECVDNILDTKYISTLFPRLAESGLSLDLFYEVKANLRLEQLAALRAGGMTSIQPGIESLSTAILQLMRKGVSGGQNIQLLRWCDELGIKVAWNLLCGFPGEPQEEYARQAELIPLLTHLQPPTSCGKFRLDRFSPHFFESEAFGIRRVRPAPAYYYVYPLGRKDLSRLAYYFDFDFADGREPDTYIRPLTKAVEKWWVSRTPGVEGAARLDALEQPDSLKITDTRPCATAAEHRLDGLPARIYRACDSGQKFTVLIKKTEAAEPDVRAAVNRLKADNLIAEIDHQYLSLAVFRNRPRTFVPSQTHDWVHIKEAAPPLPLLPAI